MKLSVHSATSATPVDGHSPRLFLDHCTAFRYRLPERFPEFQCPCNVLQTFCRQRHAVERRIKGEGGRGRRGYQGWRAFDAILNRWRTLCLMFGHVFRPGHAFCYHFPCTFVCLKCCFSARTTAQSSRWLANDLTRADCVYRMSCRCLRKGCLI